MPFFLHVIAYDSSVGIIRLAASDAGVVGVFWDKSAMEVFDTLEKTHAPDQIRLMPNAILDNAARWLDIYFSEDRWEDKKQLHNTIPPLDIASTPFRMKAWEGLRSIPFGKTITYGDFSKRIEAGNARAVGQAMGENPTPILLPCHRVVAAKGKLGGFTSGVENKRALLLHEGHKIEGEKFL